jgi:hypothetical protein
MNPRHNLNAFLYYGSLILIVMLSVCFYAPAFYFDYNSDHAIHVLMSEDFQLPRDYFYWGQNRLGSLLPLIAFLLSKFIGLHLLYICSIVQYLFLGAGYLVLSKFIVQRPLKIALCALIFLPVNEYNALILIGHPYSSQLFAGALFFLSAYLLKTHISNTETFDGKAFIIAISWSFLASLFLFAGIWVSEFNVILALIPAIFILKERKLSTIIWKGFKNGWFVAFAIISISFLGLFVYIYKQIKSQSIQDTLYDKVFIDNLQDVKRNTSYFLEQANRSLLFKDNATLENVFNWFLILLVIILIIRKFFKPKEEIRQQLLFNSLIIVCCVAALMLFFSTWNLRASFCPRYFTPVYIMFCFALLLLLDKIEYKKVLLPVVSGLFVFFCIGFCYKHVISIPNRQAPFEKHGEYAKLPKGTLIGDYWDVYKINSIAIDSLQSLPFDHISVRNWDWMEIPLKEKNFYFLKNSNIVPGGFKDIILQFGVFFKYSGKSYVCNGIEVMLYQKLFPDQSLKFAIKAYNNMYLSITKDSRIRADQPDSAKAEIFEVVLMREGHRAFRTSQGKFFCANHPQGSKVYANSDNAWGWELFEIYSVDGTRVNIKSLNGKFVCADKGNNNLLVADRAEAKDWETFVLEPR